MLVRNSNDDRAFRSDSISLWKRLFKKYDEPLFYSRDIVRSRTRKRTFVSLLCDVCCVIYSYLSKRSSRVSFSFTEFKKVEIFLQHVQLKSPCRISVIIDTIVTKREKERTGRHSPLEFKYHFSLFYFYRLFSSLVDSISSIID